jgi:hypothetical protein
MAHLGASIPTNDYPAVGLAAAGRGLKSAIIGASALGVFEKLLSGLYATASYQYAYTERADDAPELERFNTDNSTATAVLGYYITDDIEINLGGNAVIYHGGFDFLDYADESDAVQDYHDRILNERVYLVGAGASYALTDSLGLSMFFRTFVGGQNTTNVTVGGLGLAWSVL